MKKIHEKEDKLNVLLMLKRQLIKIRKPGRSHGHGFKFIDITCQLFLIIHISNSQFPSGFLVFPIVKENYNSPVNFLKIVFHAMV